MVLAKNVHLTVAQTRLLSKGLTFTPTLNADREHRMRAQYDLQSYHRKIKLAAYFKGSRQKVRLPFMGTSTWSPPIDILPPQIGTLIEADQTTFKQHYKHRQERLNLTTQELHAIKELREAKHIIIKPADKGSVVVVMHRDQYIFEAERQLNDTEYYKKLDQPIFRDTIPSVTKILQQLKTRKFINAKQLQFLKGDQEPRERRFYILPKIHKSPEKWTVPHEIPPGRPIVSDCGSETYHTAKYIDHYLTPLSTKHPAYVKDTYHFIDIISTIRVPLSAYFFTMDVASLYTNIDIPAGMRAVRKIFDKYPDPRRPDQELLQLLDINLTRNDFVFNEKYYLQIKGTAMGKTFAPAYANIFMANWEEEVFAKCTQKPTHYCRYLDDIWGVWEGSEQEFQEFLKILNGHDPSIQLKAEFHQQTIDFLDTTIYKGPNFHQTNQFDIKVFFKSTDTHALLHKTSFHPRHTFSGVVRSQILRFKRICTREEDFRQAVKTLFGVLLTRGYGRSFLRRCLRTFKDKQRRQQKTPDNLFPIVITYNSTAMMLTSRLKDNFMDIMNDNDIFPEARVLSAYRRNPNLRDLFVRARLSPLTGVRPHKLDAQFVRLKFITNAVDGTVVPIRQAFSPMSRNCIYVLLCTKCAMKYVGQTKNTLSTRMMQHRYTFKHDTKDTPLVRHFRDHGPDAVKMAGLQRDVDWTDETRRKLERRWIHLLGTIPPAGLNIKSTKDPGDHPNRTTFTPTAASTSVIPQ